MTQTVKTTKFKVGQKVRVRKDLEIYGSYKMENNPSVYDGMNAEMKEWCGKIVTIESTMRKYRLKEIGHYWTDEMLEEAIITKPIVDEVDNICSMNIFVKKVIYTEPATIIFYKTTNNPEEVLKKSVSKCRSTDKYDKAVGYQVAVLKAYTKQIRRQMAKF